jgi:short-subunit dehydrogenase
MHRGRRALITGASAGIGQAFAEHLGRAGVDLVLTARRRERLEEVARKIEKASGVQVEVIADDLADPAAPERIVRGLGPRPIDVLINNAGYGLGGGFLAAPWRAHAEFLQVMVTAMVQLTHLCLPGMVERGYGRIAQVSSLAAMLPSAGTNTLYAGSKALLVRFSESLAAELAGTGVHVTAVCPGLTRSEFHQVMGTTQELAHVPELAWQTADAVVSEALAALERGDAVHVTGRVNRFVAALARHLPQRFVRELARRGRR